MGLIWLGLAAVALWALVRLGRQTERARRGHWRISATILSAALLD
ncbi:MAG TPA: molecular chaperone DnaJ, partial [Brevundimonas sp.]|nr:molecular chaperone DnaJ [Brevundimonas sp.]